ncbi:MAG: energy-coupling factor transporter ATPase [Lachnospiraceae bacterium]|nr:energy-coupling factor transporter ATPase [Lachnospiraceae bacterium]
MSIIFDHVTHKYSPGTTMEKTALNDVSLVINDGEFIGLIGHTGSGKSTLIQHMNGLLLPTSGTVYVDGEDISEKDYSKKMLRSKVGLVFQYPEHQLFEPTVVKDVQFGPRNLGLKPLEIEYRSFEALKNVGIGDDLFDASPFELSGGQKRRVAIAGVLAMKPKVLILDEPTAGLDPAGRDEILGLISDIHKKTGITVILVSHSMEDVANYVDRIIVMNAASVVLEGPPKAVFTYAKELEGIGLSVPQVTQITRDLANKGFEISPDCITLEEAGEELLRVYRQRKGIPG